MIFTVGVNYQYMSMEKFISVITEIPEELHESLKGYLENHPTWDQDQVFVAALAKFLLQESSNQDGSVNYSDWKCARIYLETHFR
ncbi:MAG: DUF2811 domain-containing protein [Cyanobacteriota bacterium ELA615]|jgi:hypothetical protein